MKKNLKSKYKLILVIMYGICIPEEIINADHKKSKILKKSSCDKGAYYEKAYNKKNFTQDIQNFFFFRSPTVELKKQFSYLRLEQHGASSLGTSLVFFQRQKSQENFKNVLHMSQKTLPSLSSTQKFGKDIRHDGNSWVLSDTDPSIVTKRSFFSVQYQPDPYACTPQTPVLPTQRVVQPHLPAPAPPLAQDFQDASDIDLGRANKPLDKPSLHAPLVPTQKNAQP
ncbi:hypothetical protein, partial [Holospora curviuscula]|uniref:hypothetical protein n=1 Tax=Holospora curviuscula TaxID=1082868 RepID=UPI001A9C4127